MRRYALRKKNIKLRPFGRRTGRVSRLPQKKDGIFNMIITALHGLAMAIADAVPGVSGGTIGFILGFYDKLIVSLHDLPSRDKAKRIAAIKYLLKLGVGWVTGFVISMLLLKGLFERHVYIMCSAFIGLTLAAIPFMIISEKKDLKGKYQNIVFAVLGAALVVGITLLRNASFMDMNISFVNGLHGFQYLYVFITGFVAIMAMMLPGLSGSTVMLIMGVYIPAIAAAHEALHFHIPAHMILGLLPMGIGLILGVLVSVKGIKTALERHRSETIYCVLGMTLASVYAIAMAPESMKDGPGLAMTLEQGKPNSFNIIAFLIGAVIIVALELVRMRVEKKAETGNGDAPADAPEAVEGTVEGTVEDAAEGMAEDAAAVEEVCPDTETAGESADGSGDGEQA